jgi:hypothetical protein
VVSLDRPWLYPGISLVYAAALALAFLAADQLSEYMPGAWFELLGAAVLVLALLTLVILVRLAWRRMREGLQGRAIMAGAGALLASLLGLLAIYGLFENASVSAVLRGADVHLTRPVIDALPKPPGTKLLDETPGLQDTETISEDFSASNLGSIVPFYQRALGKSGWVEDKTSATTPIVRFTKGDFVLSVAIDPPSSGYTLTVDRISATPPASPTPSG